MDGKLYHIQLLIVCFINIENVMKKDSFVFILVVSLLSPFLLGCGEEENNLRTMGEWDSKPIEDYQIIPIYGGAKIIYTIPNEKGLLYVMAEYERNGKVFTEKSSLHSNELVIEGFHHVDHVKATLYKVNSNKQKSKPLQIEFEPKESLISIAQKSLELSTTFGGIVAKWANPEMTELGLKVMISDSLNAEKFVTTEMFYTKNEKERQFFRGFQSVKTTFALLFEDKWGNNSDTIFYTTTPYFETMIPKPYADYRSRIPYDNPTMLNNNPFFSFTKLWDNIVNQKSHGWLTNAGSSGLSITIDMKQCVQLSRIVTHAYHWNNPFNNLFPTSIEVWGTDKIDYEKLNDKSYWLDEWSVRRGYIKEVDITTPIPEKTFKDDWVYLGLHRFEKPKDPDVPLKVAVEGLNWEMPLAVDPVRYVRIFPRETDFHLPRNDCYYALGEITFYGNPQN